MDLISIIVPIYKVEPYLDRCVQSIVDQTYSNLEIILVDDGSPDNCPAMCDAWAEKDSRIKVIHKKNGGLSDARNAGLNTAAGTYIAFVDSDDWIHCEYIRFLYRAIQQDHSTLSACDLHMFYENDKQPDIEVVFHAEVYTSEEALETLIHGTGFRAIACNKLYHHSLLDGERFEVGRFHEDEFFTYRILAKADKLSFVNMPLYFYLQRDGSIMRTVSIKHLDALDAYLLRLQLFKQHYPNIYCKDKISFCFNCVTFYRNFLHSSGPDKKRALEKIKKCRAQIHFDTQELAKCSTKQKVYVQLSQYCIDGFSRLLNLKGLFTHE